VDADFDAIAIGAGHNALVAANVLARRGWRVLVLEAEVEPGGAVKSAAITEPGFTSDLFSSFYPLVAASPAIRSLELERHGLRWRRAPLAVAHPQPDGACAVISTDLEETAASLERFAPGDGNAWRDLYATGGAPAGPSSTRCCAPSHRCGERHAWPPRSDPAGCCASCASRSCRSAASPRALSGRRRRLAAGRQRAPRRPHAGVGGGRAVRLGAVRTRPAARVPDAGGRGGAADRNARRPPAREARRPRPFPS